MEKFFRDVMESQLDMALQTILAPYFSDDGS